ncbi:MAG TPA: hypothetical protein DIU00_12165 [Phycisphaerales bacterium]|nr:hypothetical protein [Phycisphaerales bacterium]
MKRQLILVLFTSTFLFIAFGSQNAEADIINNGEINNIYWRIQEIIEVYDSSSDQPTIVNFVNHSEISNKVKVYDYSTCNTFGTASIDHGIYGYGNSQIGIFGGEIGYGGIVSAIHTENYSQATITGGLLLGYVIADGYSQITISGGNINIGQTASMILADGHSEITISGGKFSGILRAWNSGQIIIEGRGFNYPVGEITDLAGTLTGTLLSGQTINWPFQRGWSSTSPGSITLVDETAIIPVPGALLLGMLGLSVAGLKLRKGKEL